MEEIEHNIGSNSIFVDALPYIDHGYDEPGVREAVSIRKKSASKETNPNPYFHFKGVGVG